MPTIKVPLVITAKDGVHIKGLVLAPGNAHTSNYAVTTETLLTVDTSGGTLDIDLTNVNNIDGRIIIVQDVAGNCYNNPVTMVNGSIMGKSKLATNYGILGLVYSVQSSTWYSFLNDIQKSGIAAGAGFSGTPLTYTVAFDNSYPTSEYSVSVIGDDPRIWTIKSKSTAGFVIDSNSSTALTGDVYWTATTYGS